MRHGTHNKKITKVRDLSSLKVKKSGTTNARNLRLLRKFYISQPAKHMQKTVCHLIMYILIKSMQFLKHFRIFKTSVSSILISDKPNHSVCSIYHNTSLH